MVKSTFFPTTSVMKCTLMLFVFISGGYSMVSKLSNYKGRVS